MKKFISPALSFILMSFSLASCTDQTTVMNQVITEETQSIESLSVRDDMSKSVLKLIDTNKDSKISYKEISTFTKTSNSKFESFFKASDKNKDSFLDGKEFNEFNSVLTSKTKQKNSSSKLDPKALDVLFNMVSENKTSISKDRFISYLTSQQMEEVKAVEVFNLLDTNKDGKITKDEFKVLFEEKIRKNGLSTDPNKILEYMDIASNVFIGIGFLVTGLIAVGIIIAF